MSEHYDAVNTYVSSRLSYMNRWGWVTPRGRGLYELTPEGWDILLENVRGLTLELVLASRMIYWSMSALGKEDRLVLRFQDGSVTAFHVEGGAEEKPTGEIDLGLSLLTSWPSEEAVESHLERVRPRKDG